MSHSILKRDGKPALAYRKTPAAAGHALPSVLFLPGFRSDMEGTKALYLEEQCKARGQGYIRFDYSGHGLSGGNFTDLVLSDWAEDTLAIFDTQTDGEPVVLVGSSMGGWLALLVALQRKERLAGLVGIAAAPDFTHDIYYNKMNQDQRDILDSQGYFDVPNDYSDEPYRLTKALMDDGMKNGLLDKGIDLNCPVRLVQGKLDTDVDWHFAERIKGAISGHDVQVHLVGEGDHRLSRVQDLDLIDRCVRQVSGLTD